MIRSSNNGRKRIGAFSYMEDGRRTRMAQNVKAGKRKRSVQRRRRRHPSRRRRVLSHIDMSDRARRSSPPSHPIPSHPNPPESFICARWIEVLWPVDAPPLLVLPTTTVVRSPPRCPFRPNEATLRVLRTNICAEGPAHTLVVYSCRRAFPGGGVGVGEKGRQGSLGGSSE